MIRIIVFMLIVMFTGQAQAIQIKIATISPEGSVWMEKMREGAEELAKRTDDRIKIKFYSGGVMGDDQAVLRKVRIGQLQGGAFVSGSLSQFYPDNQIYSLPLFFRSFKEIDYVRGYFDQKIIDGFEKGGLVIFGIAEGGFAYVMSTVPIYTVEDMREQKVWIPDNDSMILEAIKAFDITPIPLSIADVRAGLQTGLINTVTTPPIGALALQWHTQIKYLLDEPFLYIYGVLAVDRKVFKRLSPADQQTFREIMGDVFKVLDRRNREDNIKAIETLHKQGINFITPSAEALKKWRKDASEVPNRLIKAGKLSQEMVNSLENLIKEYRLKESKNNG
jgi:TRAP-type C4-dicarboxylate transport system substrate-binding protein